MKRIISSLFRIIMGQAFQGRLEAVINAIGGSVVNSGYSDGSTSWSVVAEFPAGTKQHDIAQLFWAKWPNAQVVVQKVR